MYIVKYIYIYIYIHIHGHIIRCIIIYLYGISIYRTIFVHLYNNINSRYFSLIINYFSSHYGEGSTV